MSNQNKFFIQIIKSLEVKKILKSLAEKEENTQQTELYLRQILSRILRKLEAGSSEIQIELLFCGRNYDQTVCSKFLIELEKIFTDRGYKNIFHRVTPRLFPEIHGYKND